MSITKDTTTASPMMSAKSNSKSNKPSKKIILRLPPSVLSQFPSAQPIRKASRSKPPIVAQQNPSTENDAATPAENASESAATPVPKNESEDTPGANESEDKGKATSSAKAGQKRSSPSDDANSKDKSRSKPGPKKRKTDNEKDNAPKIPWTAMPTTANHKLGPKANQGAINAGLRALDRTGKPCRKWAKKGLHLKSFTGVQWSLPSWSSPQPKALTTNGEAKNEASPSSDEKPHQSSSVVGSEKSNNAVDANTNGIPADAAASSPVTAPPATEVVAN